MIFFLPTGGQYTKDDFKDYEKERDKPSKFALKEKVKPKQEYPFSIKDIFWAKESLWRQSGKDLYYHHIIKACQVDVFATTSYNHLTFEVELSILPFSYDDLCEFNEIKMCCFTFVFYSSNNCFLFRVTEWHKA